MENSRLNKVFEEVKALPSKELEKLRALVDTLLAARTQTKEAKLEQMLFADGLLSEIKTPDADFKSDKDRRVVKVKGKPISETIIEERR